MREYYTFDDVLIRPAYSEIESRGDIFTSVDFLGWNLDIPILSANMDYITGPTMALKMMDAGGLGILHRFADWDQQFIDIQTVYSLGGSVAFSVGTRSTDRSLERVKLVNDACYAASNKIVCVDVAHGHHGKVIDLVARIKHTFPTWSVIAGNVATADGAVDLVQAGADAIKVGIGPGSVCTTRVVTGVGVPQLSAIIETYEAVRAYSKPIIADGGIRSAGDIVKALAAGADVVMLGSLLAGTDETPGEVIDTGRGKRVKRYQGQSIFGTNDALYTREGISGFVDYKGPVAEVLKQLMGGVRSGMSYVGAGNLADLRRSTEFIRVSPSTPTENNPRVAEYI